MKKIIRMVIVLLFLIMLVVGCNKETQKKESQETKKVVAYQMEQVVLSEEQGNYQKMKYLQESYYILSEKEQQGELLIFDQDENLIDTIGFKKEEEVSLKDFYVFEDGEFSVLSVRSGKTLEEILLYYDRYDKNGNQLLHKELGEYFIYDAWIVAEPGYLLYHDKRLILYNENGEIIWEKPAANIMFDTMMYGQNGYFYIVEYGQNGIRNLLKVNSKTGKTEETLKTDLVFAQIPDLSWGENDHEIYFCDEKKGIYCYDLEKQTSKKVLDWLESSISGEGCNSAYLWKEGFLLLSYGKEKQTERGLYKIFPEEESEKVVLTIGIINSSDSLSEKAVQFQQQHKDIQIKIRDYSEFEDSFTKLRLDIAAQDCPDILDISVGVMDSLIKKGAMVDLYSFMKNDPEMQPEKFVDSLLRTLEYNGGLYFLPASFNLHYLVCNKQILTKEEIANFSSLEKGISVELLERLREKYPKKTIYAYNHSLTFLYDSIQMGKIENLFASEEIETEFSKLLAFTKGLSKEPPVLSDISIQEQVQKKTLLFWEIFANSPLIDSIQYRTCYGKGNYIFCGYPCTQGSGVWLDTMSGQGCSFGISVSCKNKNEAWQFIRSFLTEQEQEKKGGAGSLPVRKEALEKCLNERKVYNGKERTMTKEEKKNYLKLIDSAEFYSFPIDEKRGALYDIIREEANAYFLDEKSLEEAVSLMKNRIGLYISEQE